MITFDPAPDSAAHSHTLAVDMRLEENDDLRMTFWLEGAGLQKPDGHEGQDNPNWQLFKGELVIGIGLAPSSEAVITCGDDTESRRVRFDELSPGMQDAVEVDLRADEGSALNPGWRDRWEKLNQSVGTSASTAEPDTSEPEPADPNGFVYSSFSTPMAMLSTDYYRTTRWKSEDSDWVWAESCVIPASEVWRSSKNSIYEQASRKSLLIPQVNFVTSGAEEMTVQQGIATRLYLDRKLTDSLVYSKPVPDELESSRWQFDIPAHALGDNRFFYTRQSVVILENTEVTGRRELGLLLFGVLAGAVGSLIVIAARSFMRAHYATREKISSRS